MAENTIKINDKNYLLENLSDRAKELIQSINFADQQIEQLNNEWAIADTARIAYTRALKSSVEDTKKE